MIASIVALYEPWEYALRRSIHRADCDITGSCHLVQCAGRRVPIDCVLYHGNRAITEENAGDFGFDPAGIDFALL